jgi:NitT/TauT family transport system substrate-binding protein
MKKWLLAGILTLLAVVGAACVACSPTGAASGESPQAAGRPDAAPVTIAVMPTEDSLPLWVAERDGLFAANGAEVKLESFQSAQELIAAVTSGAANMAVTDPMVTASLTAGGTPMSFEWVTLGETAAEGRFGIMTSPDSKITELGQLKGVPIAVGSNTIVEYMMDKILEAAGFAPDDIKTEEIKKIPVRYESMANNSVKAAALPSATLAVGEKAGMVLLADDTEGDNLTQSVMIASEALIAEDGGTAAIDGVSAAWNEAVKRINGDPEAFRQLLVDKASLPQPIAESYPVSHYPEALLPTSKMIDPVLDWMKGKGYLKQDLSYEPETGKLKGGSPA